MELPDWLVCRIRNDLQQSSTNKGNKQGGSKSPLGYPHDHVQARRGYDDHHNDRSPERSSVGGFGQVKSQNVTSLRRNQPQI